MTRSLGSRLRSVSSMALALAVLAAAGCTTEELAHPLPRQFVISASGTPPDVAEPVRYAVLWTLPSGGPPFVVVDDGPASLSGGFSVTFTLPSSEVTEHAGPREQLSLGTDSNLTAAAFRPRIVLYADNDGNAHFDPTLFELAGPDEILAVDEAGTATVAAVLNLDAILKKLPLERAATFEHATDGRFTAFLPVYASGSVLVFASGVSPGVDFERANLARASIECFRGALPVLENTRSITVDTELDPRLCDLGFGACAQGDLDSLPPPDLDSGLSQCRQNGNLETLIHASTPVVTCEGCACTSAGELEIFVAGRGASPGWWPCGTSVPFCDSPMSLVDYAYDCRSDASTE